MKFKSFFDIATEDFQRLSHHIHLNSLSGKTILLSGATGFFGAWILALLAWTQRNHGLHIKLVVISRDPHSFIQKHPWVKDSLSIQWIQGDIQSFTFPNDSIDLLIHAATDTSAAAGAQANRLIHSMIAGTEHILNCARQCHIKRILLVSSGAAYGAQPADLEYLSESESMAPSTLKYESAYGEGKRIMELLASIHAKETATEVVIARCFAFLGAGLPLNTHFAIGNFIRDALKSDQIIIQSDGKDIRSYLYAADLSIWLLSLLLNGKNLSLYNVGSDDAVSIAQLAAQVIEELAPHKSLVIKGLRPLGSAKTRYLPSIHRAREELHLDVWTKLPQAIFNTACWAMNA